MFYYDTARVQLETDMLFYDGANLVNILTYSLHLQKMLKVITLGQAETDNINQMITITDYFYSDLLLYSTNGSYENWSLNVADNIYCGHIKWPTL
jgi:hypothetical protein